MAAMALLQHTGLPPRAPIKSGWPLPYELTMRILACCEPSDLKRAHLVCKSWYCLLNDESCWKHALLTYFRVLPLRRLSSSSWKKEYLKRLRLLKDWHRSKQVLTFDPSYYIDAMLMDYDANLMILGNVSGGVVGTACPWTGRMSKSQFQGNGLQHEFQVTAMALERYRILVGYSTGEVGWVSNIEQGIQANQTKFPVLPRHGVSPVTAIVSHAKAINLIVSGHADGMILVWDVPTLRCVAVLVGDRSGIAKVVFDPKRHVIATCTSGKTLVWDIELEALMTKTLSGVSRTSPAPVAERVPSRSYEHGRGLQVHSLFWDANAGLAVTGVPTPDGIHAWCPSHGQPLVLFSKFHSHPVSIIEWDRSREGASHRSSSLLVSADSHGSVAVWELSDPQEMYTRPGALVDASALPTLTPLWSIMGLHDGPVTHIALDPFKIVTAGGATCQFHVTDIMTGLRIHSIAYKRGLHTGQRQVGCLWSGPHQVIATFGSTVKAWDFEPGGIARRLGSKDSRKNRNASQAGPSTPTDGGRRRSGLNGRPSSAKGVMSPRQFREHDIVSDARDTIRRMDYEKRERDYLERQQLRYNGVPSSGGAGSMTEEELISYAMMLSMEEQSRASPLEGAALGTSHPNRSLPSPVAMPSPSPHRIDTSRGSRQSPQVGSFGSVRSRASNSKAGSYRDGFDHYYEDWTDEEEEDWVEAYRPPSASSSSSQRYPRGSVETPSGSVQRWVMSGGRRPSEREGAVGSWTKSPTLRPQSSQKVNVVSRDEDEELQYALEMSLHEM